MAKLMMGLVIGVMALISSLASSEKVIYEATKVAFKLPEKFQGDFIPENCVPAGVKFHKGSLYVTVPRWKKGVPSTLNKVEKDVSSYTLVPYPNFEMQSKFQYVQSMEIDSKDRMWVLDTGRTNIFEKDFEIPGTPKIYIINLTTNEVIFEHTFPEDVASSTSSFINDIAVDDTLDVAYISEASGSGAIVVFDLNTNQSWKVTDPSMSFNPDLHYVIDSVDMNNFKIPIDGITLSADHQTVYFNALLGNHLFSVPAAELRNKKPLTITDHGEKRPSDGLAFSDNGKLYFGGLDSSSIHEWDPSTSLADVRQVSHSDDLLKWPDTFAFDDNGNLLVLSNRLHLFIDGKMKFDGDANFRVVSIPVGGGSYVNGPKQSGSKTASSTTTAAATSTTTVTSTEKAAPIAAASSSTSTTATTTAAVVPDSVAPSNTATAATTDVPIAATAAAVAVEPVNPVSDTASATTTPPVADNASPAPTATTTSTTQHVGAETAAPTATTSTTQTTKTAAPASTPASNPSTSSSFQHYADAAQNLALSLSALGNSCVQSPSTCLPSARVLVVDIFFTQPLQFAFFFCLVSSLLCWVLSLLTGDLSIVDRLWSILPPVYVVYFWSHSPHNPRLAAMAALAVSWGVRLTFNFWRKGGYTAEGEDYRWTVLRQRMSPLTMQIFNLTFVAFIQNILLFVITLPAYVALQNCHVVVTLGDFVASLLFAAALALETAADEEQFEFQQSKHGKTPRLAHHTADYQKGFLTTGLFSLSRHPNFFAEQTIWVSFTLFAVCATHSPCWPALVGAVSLMALFQGSTGFTEEITLAKYPQYEEYQATTSRLWPWFSYSSVTVPHVHQE